MSWAGLGSSDWVIKSDLQDAVNTSVLKLRSGASITGTTDFNKVSEVNASVICKNIIGDVNRWPVKSEIEPIAAYLCGNPGSEQVLTYLGPIGNGGGNVYEAYYDLGTTSGFVDINGGIGNVDACGLFIEVLYNGVVLASTTLYSSSATYSFTGISYTYDGSNPYIIVRHTYNVC